MMNPSTMIAGGTRVSGRSDSVAQHREDWRVARSVHADLVLMGMPHVNLLLTGADGVISNVLDTLLPDLEEPIARWSAGERAVLPSLAQPRREGELQLGTEPAPERRRVAEEQERVEALKHLQALDLSSFRARAVSSWRASSVISACASRSVIPSARRPTSPTTLQLREKPSQKR